MEKVDSPIKRATLLYLQAASQYSEARSEAYRSGVMAVLLYKFGGGMPSQTCPYTPGSTQIHDFNLGCESAADIWEDRENIALQARRAGPGRTV